MSDEDRNWKFLILEGLCFAVLILAVVITVSGLGLGIFEMLKEFMGGK